MNQDAVEQAVRQFLNQMTADQLSRSNAYFEGGYWLILWNFLMAMAVAVILMRTGLSVNLRDRAERWSRWSWLSNWIYFVQYMVVVSVITLPMSIYQDYYREHFYGLSNLSFGAWTVEQLKGLGLAVVLGGVFVSVIMGVIRRAPKTWWVWGTCASILFLVLTVVISPVFLAPVFNDYKPLSDGEVRTAVLAMARANDVPANEVYQFDASRQSKRISANVSGIFGTMRVSLNDNLLNRADLAEVRAVMGHEIGHYVLHHVHKFVLEFGLMLLIGFYFCFRGANWYVQKFGAAWGIHSAGDVAVLPVLVALFSIFMFVGTPVFNTISRTAEIEADYFGLNLAREPDAFARVALLLSEYRKISPGYWEEVFFYDHPSGENRIRAAMRWKLENLK